MSTLRKHLHRLPILLAILIGFGLGCGVVMASDGDLQQYNGSPTWSSDLTAAQLLCVRDGKLITADNNAVGRAPVNRSIKELKDLLIGVHDGIFGSRAGSQLRTVRSLQADGSGGAASTAANGEIRASSSVWAGKDVASDTVPTPSVVAAGEFPRAAAPIGMAAVNAGFTALYKGYGIYALSRTGPGDYTVTFQLSPGTGPAYHNSVVSISPYSGSGFCSHQKSLDGGNRLVVRVVCSGAVDLPFDIVAWVF